VTLSNVIAAATLGLYYRYSVDRGMLRRAADATPAD
jgi:hypothetical protein